MNRVALFKRDAVHGADRLMTHGADQPLLRRAIVLESFFRHGNEWGDSTNDHPRH